MDDDRVSVQIARRSLALIEGSVTIEEMVAECDRLGYDYELANDSDRMTRDDGHVVTVNTRHRAVLESSRRQVTSVEPSPRQALATALALMMAPEEEAGNE